MSNPNVGESSMQHIIKHMECFFKSATYCQTYGVLLQICNILSNIWSASSNLQHIVKHMECFFKSATYYQMTQYYLRNRDLKKKNMEEVDFGLTLTLSMRRISSSSNEIVQLMSNEYNQQG
ncbi:unnamed protein product [Vicia faba]|uniref:Uncharacterized protein n=1 Tax=Vicia faba TaxID=3906 RepID=A0AAV1B6B5_VICFA|nr:unnamed protein product [Vicia faba]